MSDRLKKGLHSSNVQPTFDVIDNIKGTTLYNFNQHFVEVEQDGEEKVKVNEYNSLRVDYPINANHIFETLITEMYPNNEEQKMLNDYNAVQLGIEPEDKKQAYLNFLEVRKQMRALVDSDCTINNIPLQ